MRVVSKLVPALALALAFVLGGLAPAHADFLSGTIRVHGGGAGGFGISGDLEEEAFSQGARGGTFGARVGVEILFMNLWLGHDQYRDRDGLVGTWTTLPMLGFDSQFDVGSPGTPTQLASGKMVKGKSKWFIHIGLGAGFGLGTGQQIDPPLDNSEVTDKGFMLEGEMGLARRLGKYFSMGIAVPLQLRVMYKNGAGQAVNEPSSRYESFAYSALLNLRLKIKLF